MRWIATAALLCAALPTGAQAGRVVRITIDNAAIRSGPSDTYDRVAVLPAGLKLPVISREGGWYRVALGELLQPYVHSSIVTLLPEGAAPSQGRVTDLSTGGFPKGTRVTLSLTAPVPYRIIQRLRPAALVLELFNCRLAQYGVRQRAGDDLVLAIEQVQLSANTTQITFHLPQKQQTGYEARFEGDALILDIRRPYQTGELRKTVLLEGWYVKASERAHSEVWVLNPKAFWSVAAFLCAACGVPFVLHAVTTSIWAIATASCLLAGVILGKAGYAALPNSSEGFST